MRTKPYCSSTAPHSWLNWLSSTTVECCSIAVAEAELESAEEAAAGVAAPAAWTVEVEAEG